MCRGPWVSDLERRRAGKKSTDLARFSAEPPQTRCDSTAGVPYHFKGMPELIWVVAALLAVFGFGLVELVPWTDLLAAGNAVMLGCAAVGVPLEILYFASLGLALQLNGTRPPGWFWRPFQHHHLLVRRQKLCILPFYYSGALSFLGIVIGILLVVLGIVAAVRQS